MNSDNNKSMSVDGVDLSENIENNKFYMDSKEMSENDCDKDANKEDIMIESSSGDDDDDSEEDSSDSQDDDEDKENEKVLKSVAQSAELARLRTVLDEYNLKLIVSTNDIKKVDKLMKEFSTDTLGVLTKLTTYAFIRKLVSGDERMYDYLINEYEGEVDEKEVWNHGLCYECDEVMSYCRDNYVVTNEIKRALSMYINDFVNPQEAVGDNDEWKAMIV